MDWADLFSARDIKHSLQLKAHGRNSSQERERETEREKGREGERNNKYINI